MGRNAEAEKKVARGVARKVRKDEPEDESRGRGEVHGADLEPIGVVKRELKRPDGTTIVVEVPVYPPFRLAEYPGGRKPARNRSAPSIKGKRGRTRSSG
jgi:hypothetical protein